MRFYYNGELKYTLKLPKYNKFLVTFATDFGLLYIM